jgi:hypothetical protein
MVAHRGKKETAVRLRIVSAVWRCDDSIILFAVNDISAAEVKEVAT